MEESVASRMALAVEKGSCVVTMVHGSSKTFSQLEQKRLNLGGSDGARVLEPSVAPSNWWR